MTATLVLGGARSGKSAFAQRAAERASTRGRPILMATGQAFDDEMRLRIARHQAERGEAWETRETPLELAEAIGRLQPGDVAVVDCLTLWLSNQMLADAELAEERKALVESVANSPARLWLVSNEVGWGVVPDNALARRFRDEAGWLHQALAERVDTVLLVVAGLPMPLKGAAA